MARPAKKGAQAKGRMRAGSGKAGPAEGRQAPDRQAMERAISLFLRAAGAPLSAADRVRTPERVAEAWALELLGGYATDPVAELTWEPAGRGGGLVVLRDIVFHSMCVHHLLPFFGRAHVAYIPNRRLVGLSKVARVVDILARRLQVQERLTDGVVDAIVRGLRPAGAACVIEAEHLCVACRGVRRSGVKIVTTRFTGRLARGPLHDEALRLLTPPPPPLPRGGKRP
jgi:GTP cyclohydrolase I